MVALPQQFLKRFPGPHGQSFFRPRRLYKAMALAGPLNSAATASFERIILDNRFMPACPRNNI
jgi:hypothetical protein